MIDSMGQFLAAFSPLFTVGSSVGGEDKAAGFEGLSSARREERLLIRAVPALSGETPG